MFQVKFCVLFIITFTIVDAGRKCGFEAPDCKYDVNGNIDWKVVQPNDGPLVCRAGFSLITKAPNRGCCKENQKTTPPMTTECLYDVPCRNRYVWVQEFCECVCPPYVCPPGTERGNDCDCIPETTTTDACPYRATCFGRKVWDESVCDCVCPSSAGECRNNWIWDPWSCDCICLENTCPPGSFNGGDCNCIPDPNWPTSEAPCEPQPCNRSFFWNRETCSCQLGCDFIRECAPGLKWDIFKCDCIEACPGVQCPENYVATDPFCNCECNITETSCPRGTVFNPSFCQCSVPCIEQECPRGYYWFQDACQCFLICDYIDNCEIEDWDFIECACKATTPTESTTPPCILTDEDCSGPLEFLNYDTCECQRRPCDPLICSKGFTFDWTYCRCEPDYVTTDIF